MSELKQKYYCDYKDECSATSCKGIYPYVYFLDGLFPLGKIKGIYVNFDFNRKYYCGYSEKYVKFVNERHFKLNKLKDVI